jgi:hypothetical protein
MFGGAGMQQQINPVNQIQGLIDGNDNLVQLPDPAEAISIIKFSPSPDIPEN